VPGIVSKEFDHKIEGKTSFSNEFYLIYEKFDVDYNHEKDQFPSNFLWYPNWNNQNVRKYFVHHQLQ
jgi:hypothetical protein